jgi:hypothetical protein
MQLPHFSRMLGSAISGIWQSTAAPGIKRGLTWSGVYESAQSPKHRLSAPLLPAGAAKTTTSIETTVAVPGLWKALQIRLSSKFF